jgi:hypothetical protein
MIGHIQQTGKYTAVTGGPASNHINNSGYMGVGQLQFNTNTQRMEMYNGIDWQPLTLGTYYVGLNPDAEQILDWARNKIHEEQELERLAKDNVAIQDLVKQINEKKDQIKMVHILTKKESEQSINWAQSPYGTS